MRYSFFSSLAGVLAASAVTHTVSAQSTLPPPQFTAILTGQFNETTVQAQTTGPFGTRVHLASGGGRMLNATTGETVATILSFADNGVTANSGVIFPSSVMPLTWSADGHFASVFLNGVGNQSAHVSHARVETDSPTYSWMNGKFFIAKIDSSNLPVVSFTMYEETS